MPDLMTMAGFLKSKGLDFETQGKNLSVDTLLALEPGLKNTLCYYTGTDLQKLSAIHQSIIVCRPELKPQLETVSHNAYIFTHHPQLCFYWLSTLFQSPAPPEIHASAIIHPNARIGQGVSIGAFALLEDCRIGDHVSIGPGVKIHAGVEIEDHVQIEANSVIGATGMMWAWTQDGNKVRCYQTGSVHIQKQVFIGSNVTIVKGAYPNKPTVIQEKTMLAHGTLIGHGCIVGPNNHFANNISLGGSVQTGNACFLGSGAAIRPHIHLPDHTIVGTGAVVVKNFTTPGLTLVGNPAKVLKAERHHLSGIPDFYDKGQ